MRVAPVPPDLPAPYIQLRYDCSATPGVILIGELSLWVALLMAIWAATVSCAGGALERRDLTLSGERAIYATLAMVVLASIGLWTALFTHDFSIKYVASFSSANLPRVYTFTAFWVGQAGSMLFWCLILAIYSSIAVFNNRAKNRELMPYVTGTLAIVLIFFLATMCLGANPFERLEWVPADGRGMNPQLQNPGMVVHPPNLYLGYVGTTIPFAFAIAALITRRFDSAWLTAIRKWVLIAWFFNTTGILLGMWWAYVEPGWGGYWAWDPVENASLLPWLVNTAFLHSVIVQEKCGMLRRWNVILVVTAFLLSIPGAFITRTGFISSAQSFAQSPAGNWFAGFLILAIIVTAFLVATRLQDLEAKATLESIVSREAALLYSSIILAGIALSVLGGTLLPVITEAVRGERITVGPPYFNAVDIPLGLTLLFFTGVGPILAWRRASRADLQRQLVTPALAGFTTAVTLFILGMRDFSAILAFSFAGLVAMTVIQEFYNGVGARRKMYGEGAARAFPRLISHHRRRYGGYIVHMGVAVIFSGFAGLAFIKEFHLSLGEGASRELVDPYGHRWTFVNQGISQYDILNRQVTALALDLARDGKPAGVVTTEKRQHIDSRGAPTFEPSTEAGIRESWRQDVHVVLSGVDENQVAAIRVSFNPLVRFVWLGGVLMAIGGLVVMWPRVGQKPRSDDT